ncbi:MAG: helix-turn-helix domain-containing protein [Candidatus Liptonbacteria bacterium]|nr:helix-turn-helix domain-containing protein [Candidatus Liptonbacteria bacterium]
MDYSEFSTFLNERMRERGFNIRRLSELTGVSLQHLEAIFSGNYDRLPPAPYLKGYISRLGDVLDFDSDEAWEHIKKFANPKSSGKADELPKNRFSQKPIGGYLVAGAVALVLLIYLGFRFYTISGTPVITVTYPTEDMTVVYGNYINITGKVSNSDELRIGNEQIEVQPNGEWQKTVMLSPEMNNIEITAKKFLGKETKVALRVFYQQPAAQPTSTQQNGGF